MFSNTCAVAAPVCPLLSLYYCLNAMVATAQTIQTHDPVDIMVDHISPVGRYSSTWKEARGLYEDIMRLRDINFVTVLREPRSHLIRLPPRIPLIA